jgi:hypothetical protein
MRLYHFTNHGSLWPLPADTAPGLVGIPCPDHIRPTTDYDGTGLEQVVWLTTNPATKPAEDPDTLIFRFTLVIPSLDRKLVKATKWKSQCLNGLTWRAGFTATSPLERFVHAEAMKNWWVYRGCLPGKWIREIKPLIGQDRIWDAPCAVIGDE